MAGEDDQWQWQSPDEFKFQVPGDRAFYDSRNDWQGPDGRMWGRVAGINEPEFLTGNDGDGDYQYANSNFGMTPESYSKDIFSRYGINVPTAVHNDSIFAPHDLLVQVAQKINSGNGWLQNFLDGPGPVGILASLFTGGAVGLNSLFSGGADALGSIASGATGAFDMGGLTGTGIPEAWGITGGSGVGAATGGSMDVWDLMGDPSAYGLGEAASEVAPAASAAADNWDLMGDPSAYGLGSGTDAGGGIINLLKKIPGGAQNLLKMLTGGGAAGGGRPQDIMKLLGLGGNSAGSNLLSVLAGLYGRNQAKDIGAFAGPAKDASGLLQQLMGGAAAQTPLPNAPTMKTVGDVTQLPGYQQLLAQRETALSRRLAAQGYNRSGNEMAALADLGGEQYNQFYNTESQRVQQENTLTQRQYETDVSKIQNQNRLAVESRNAEMDRLARISMGGLAAETASKTMDAGAINRILYGASGLLDKALA